MRIGISPFASTRTGSLAVADAAVSGGIDSLWLGEGLIAMPQFPPWSGGQEPLTWLAFLAGRFEGIRVGVCASVLPLRDVTWLAKAAATLDQLTEGNFVLALTPGNWAREYEFRGLDFASRGRRFASALDALEAALAGREHHSEVADYPGDARLSPAPYNGVAPELWLAGGAATARRALARGWPIQLRLAPLEQLAGQAAAWYGDGGAPLGLRAHLRLTKSGPAGLVTGPVGPELAGPPAELAQVLADLDQLGIADLSIIPGNDDAVSLATVNALVNEVIPRYRELVAGAAR